jgi:hypothetical protein
MIENGSWCSNAFSFKGVFYGVLLSCKAIIIIIVSCHEAQKQVIDDSPDPKTVQPITLGNLTKI